MTIRMSLVLSACALALAAAPALAQDGYANGPESVTVTSPRLHEEWSNGLQQVPEKASLSEAVSYADLDLTTHDGAHRLRNRVRFAAMRVCRNLADMYPHALAGSEPCYKTALSGGLSRADEAITSERIAYREGE